MGRYAERLIRRTSISNPSRGDTLRNSILNSLNFSKHYTNFKRKLSVDNFWNKQLQTLEVERVEGGIDYNNIKNDCPKESVAKRGPVEDFEVWNNYWKTLAMAGFEEGMNWDLSNVKTLQTLSLSKGDVNSVAFGRNLILASGSG
jgi:phenylalanyl-tRNA synthetase beta subunit